VGSGSVAPVLVLNGETETNFTVTSQDGSWEITPAAVTATAGSYNGTYDGVTHSPEACAVTGTYKGNLSCTNSPASVGPNVGSGSIVPVLVLNGETQTNFTVTSQNGSWEITPADPSCSISGFSGIYDGDPHGASGECTGVKGETLTGLDLGATFTDVPGGTANWTFTDTSGNYNDASGSVDITINKAAATIVVAGYEGVYDGQPHGATLTSAIGVNSEDLSGSVILGTGTFTDAPGGQVAWSFEHNNYEAQNGTVDITINKAAATIVVAGYEGVYDGDSHGGTLTSATGVNSEDLSGSVTVGTETFTNVPGGQVAWSFEHNNYEAQNGTVNIVINKAAATIVVAGYEGVYDGQPYGATLTSATGVNSEDLSGSVIVGTQTFTNVPGGQVAWSFEHNNYEAQNGTVNIVINKAAATIIVTGKTVTYDGEEHGASGSATGVKGETLAGLDLGGTFTNYPGGTANWTFTDETGNYNNDSGNVDIVITKADPICEISGYTGVYDDELHGATGSCTGVKGETLTTLDLGGTFTLVPGSTAYWTFTDSSGNYKDVSGSVNIVITEAKPTCSINGYTGVYDGDPHGASGTCTGVKGETLTILNLGGTYTNYPGGTANWTFIDTSGNYKNASGSVKIVIEQATLIVTADNQTAQYSDATPPLTFKYSGFAGSEGPDDLTTKPTCSTTRLIISPAGDYPITCAGGVDDNYTFNYVEGKFTVTKESAGITYTGDTQVTTAKVGAKAKVTLAAVLEEEQDGWLGEHLAGQKILFEVFSFGDTSFSKPLASCTAIVNNVAEGKGYGSCTLYLSAADPYQVRISLVGNNFYQADFESVVVLVNDPGTGMANGGGWLIDPNTDGRVSFGFTAKFLKNGRVQGNSLFIYRITTDLSTIVPGAPEGERDYNWIIKSNAMQGLYIYDCTVKTTSGCKATITGKNTVQAVDRETGVLYSIGGNYQFQVDVIDNQEPGSSGTGPDQYAIRVWDSSGTYYELGSCYDKNGKLLNTQDIAGGNIQVKAKK
jgi:hypothetical protein